MESLIKTAHRLEFEAAISDQIAKAGKSQTGKEEPTEVGGKPRGHGPSGKKVMHGA